MAGLMLLRISPRGLAYGWKIAIFSGMAGSRITWWESASHHLLHQQAAPESEA